MRGKSAASPAQAAAAAKRQRDICRRSAQPLCSAPGAQIAFKELVGRGGKALSVVTDVTNRDQVKSLVDTAVEKFGRIDVLINNAGLMPHSPLERLNSDARDRMIDVNIKGVLCGIVAALVASS